MRQSQCPRETGGCRQAGTGWACEGVEFQHVVAAKVVQAQALGNGGAVADQRRRLASPALCDAERHDLRRIARRLPSSTADAADQDG